MALRALDERHFIVHISLVGVAINADSLRFCNVVNAETVAIETFDPPFGEVNLVSRRFFDIVPALCLCHVTLRANGMIQMGMMDHFVGALRNIHPDLMEALPFTLLVTVMAIDHGVGSRLPALERLLHGVATDAERRIVFDVVVTRFKKEGYSEENHGGDQRGDPMDGPFKPLNDPFHVVLHGAVH